MEKKNKKAVRKDYEEKAKNRTIRALDEDWEYFTSLKPRGKSWSIFLTELTTVIKKIKDL